MAIRKHEALEDSRRSGALLGEVHSQEELETQRTLDNYFWKTPQALHSIAARSQIPLGLILFAAPSQNQPPAPKLAPPKLASKPAQGIPPPVACVQLGGAPPRPCGAQPARSQCGDGSQCQTSINCNKNNSRLRQTRQALGTIGSSRGKKGRRRRSRSRRGSRLSIRRPTD